MNPNPTSKAMEDHLEAVRNFLELLRNDNDAFDLSAVQKANAAWAEVEASASCLISAERESCAKVCETHESVGDHDPQYMVQGMLAAAIRGRKP